jgi:hypothetical protein
MNEDQMIKLELTARQTDVVLMALSKLPYEVVCLLIANIEAQARNQVSHQSKQE